MRSLGCAVSLALLLGLVPATGLASAETEDAASAKTEAKPTYKIVKRDKFNIEEQSHLLEFGIFLGGFFPAQAHELFDPDAGYKALDKGGFMLGVRAAYLPWRYLGLELEGAIVSTGIRDSDESALLYTMRAHVIGQLPWWRVTPFVLAGYGMQGITSDEIAGVGDDIDGTFHAGLGLKWYATNQHILRAEGRVDVGGETDPGGYVPHFEFLVSAAYVINWANQPDRDSDGVYDEDDQCPDRAGDKPTGCPPDRDGDGVFDADDKCPELAGDKPEGCPPDRDGDGVYDADDKCVELAGDKPEGCPPDKDGDGVFDRDDKCVDKPGVKPTGCPADSDGDGIPDSDDRCPNQASSEKDGCPADSDGDGILDKDDKCPKKAETRNGYEDKDGCPDKIPRKIKRITGAIKGIYFASGKATIQKKSFRVLNGAAKVLGKYKGLRIRIEGHTDDVGADDANMKLSEARAAAVKQYFVDKGIEDNRLEAVGKGETEPVDPKKTRRARSRNRRIEFKLVMDVEETAAAAEAAAVQKAAEEAGVNKEAGEKAEEKTDGKK